jgi:hypothetical protein
MHNWIKILTVQSTRKKIRIIAYAKLCISLLPDLNYYSFILFYFNKIFYISQTFYIRLNIFLWHKLSWYEKSAYVSENYSLLSLNAE